VRWLPRLRLRYPAPGSTPERPAASCLRCGGNAVAGYVTASAWRRRSGAEIGWITGEPGVELWPEAVLAPLTFAEPTRVPGYRCPGCGLIWLDPAEPPTDS
jgi:hypothetical protein